MRKKSQPFKVIKISQILFKEIGKCNTSGEDRERITKISDSSESPENFKNTYQGFSVSVDCNSESSEFSESSQDSESIPVEQNLITTGKNQEIKERYVVPAFSSYSKHKMLLWENNPSRQNLQNLKKSLVGLRLLGPEIETGKQKFIPATPLPKKRPAKKKVPKLKSEETLPFKCEYCNKRLPYQSNLKQHLRTHTGERPYVCNVCNRAFAKKAYLNGHASVHTGEKPFKCYVCDQRCTRKQGLKRHIRRFHQNISPAAYLRSFLGV